jgi:hypothetical protein
VRDTDGKEEHCTLFFSKGYLVLWSKIRAESREEKTYPSILAVLLYF